MATLTEGYLNMRRGSSHPFTILCHVGCYIHLKVLLSRDELMQLSAVQCVEEVLLHHMDYGRVLLRSDIAGIL